MRRAMPVALKDEAGARAEPKEVNRIRLLKMGRRRNRYFASMSRTARNAHSEISACTGTDARTLTLAGSISNDKPDKIREPKVPMTNGNPPSVFGALL